MGLEPGFAYIAPGGRHLKVEQRVGRRLLRLTDDAPENSVRPSVDYLFRSAADVFEDRAIAIVLTGMGRDGVEGCRALKQHGAFVITQHPDGCTVFGMPKAVAEEDLADEVLPLERIAGDVLHRVRRKRRLRP
jgi:two-component system chemotaxis response regulator CheB